jgi:hypothetical protein
VRIVLSQGGWGLLGPRKGSVCIDGLNDTEGSANDSLCSVCYPLKPFAVLCTVVTIPHIDGSSQDALYCALVEVDLSAGTHAKLLQ